MPTKAEAEKIPCSARNFFGSKESGKKCKVCDACENDSKPGCVLHPYNSGCCPGQEAHHVLPVRGFLLPNTRSKVPKGKEDFYEGCDKYDLDRAPCICLDEVKHDAVHDYHNPKERQAGLDNLANPGRWSYEEASQQAAESIEKRGGKKCSSACIKEQLDAYHTAKPPKGAGINKKTLLRADPSGRRKTSKVQGSTLEQASLGLG